MVYHAPDWLNQWLEAWAKWRLTADSRTLRPGTERNGSTRREARSSWSPVGLEGGSHWLRAVQQAMDRVEASHPEWVEALVLHYTGTKGNRTQRWRRAQAEKVIRAALEAEYSRE